MLDGSVVLTPFDEAARRFKTTERELREALDNRWILGDPEVGVDAETVKKWMVGREEWIERQGREKKRPGRTPAQGLHIMPDQTQAVGRSMGKISVGRGKYGK